MNSSSAEKRPKLHVQKADPPTNTKKDSIQKQIDAVDAKIDALVYDLYGLDQDDIDLIEASF